MKKHLDFIETHILPTLGDVKVTKITAAMINAYAVNKDAGGQA